MIIRRAQLQKLMTKHKNKTKKKQKTKENFLTNDLASNQTPLISANAQTNKMVLMLNLVYVKRKAVKNF